MRRLAFFLSAAAIAAQPTPAVALDMPARKPGLWELKTTTDGRPESIGIIQQCIDAATDKQMSVMGGNMRAQRCSKQDMQRSGNTITVDSVCDIGAGTVSAHTVITGSFDSAYTLAMTSKRQGFPATPNLPAESKVTMEAKWLGPCAADQKPGDMMMEGGIKMNILNMPGGMQKR